MTAVPTTTTVLSPAAIERLELDTRADLISALTNLERLRAGSAHVVAGFPDWHDYVLARFGDLLDQLRMPIAERRELVLRLRRGDGVKGMSQRAIAAKLGVGLGTVSEDIAELRRDGRLVDEPAKVTSGDGRDRPSRGESRPGVAATVAVAVPLPAPAGRVYQQAAEWLRRTDGGLTLVELAAVAGWTEGKASGALSYLTHPSRALAVRLEEERAGQRVHVLTAAGRGMLADLAAAAPEPAPVEVPTCSGHRMVWAAGEFTIALAE